MIFHPISRFCLRQNLFLFYKLYPSQKVIHKIVDNSLYNPMDNPIITQSITFELSTPPGGRLKTVDIHIVISNFCCTFPRFFFNKRYKLINFAPNWENVDNYVKSLKYKASVFTVMVDKPNSHVDNEITKYSGRKFFTYPHDIIIPIFFFL